MKKILDKFLSLFGIKALDKDKYDDLKDREKLLKSNVQLRSRVEDLKEKFDKLKRLKRVTEKERDIPLLIGKEFGTNIQPEGEERINFLGRMVSFYEGYLKKWIEQRLSDYHLLLEDKTLGVDKQNIVKNTHEDDLKIKGSIRCLRDMDSEFRAYKGELQELQENESDNN